MSGDGRGRLGCKPQEEEAGGGESERLQLEVHTHRLAGGHGAERADAVGVCDDHGRGEPRRVGILRRLLLVRIHCERESRKKKKIIFRLVTFKVTFSNF